MSQQEMESRPCDWSQVFFFCPVFRGFKLACDTRKIILAAAGIFCIYMGGRALDAVWADGSRMLIAQDTNEIQEYQMSGLSCSATHDWVRQAEKDRAAKRQGIFAALLNHEQVAIYRATQGVLSLSASQLIAAKVSALAGILWLVSLHPLYAAVFLVFSLAVWSLFGGAVCRLAAVDATRDERLRMGAALAFARAKFWSFFFAPLLPLAFCVALGLLMAFGGLIGAIPFVGTLVTPLLWFLALGGGFIMALLVVGLAAGWPLMYPTIAVEGSDAFDAFSRSYAYLWERIWRAVTYAVAAMVYGAICFTFIKFLARIGLFLVHQAVGLGMNLGSATGANGHAIEHKLDAMWRAPSLDFSTPFYGTFGHESLSGVSRLGAFLIAMWTFGAFTLVAAFLVSYLHSASTLAYLLLRRDVDATDWEEVYLDAEMEDGDAGTPAEPPAPSEPPGKVSSLPIVGQTEP